MRESTVEDYLVLSVKAHNGKCYKFISPGHVGVPDRICIFPPGRIYFVEVKAPGKTPRPSQLAVHREMESVGIKVWVLDSKAAVKEFIRGASTYAI